MREAMKTGVLITLFLSFFSIAGWAQQSQPIDSYGRNVSAERGAKVFAATCTGFCHGENGTVGSGAPALASRGLDAQHIEDAIKFGVPGTAMPAWAQKLPQEDWMAVANYVKSLNGISLTAKALPVLSPEAARGRDLFLDTGGEIRACSNCHSVAGKGLAVTPPIQRIPADVSELRNLPIRQVSAATVNGDTFPAVIVATYAGKIKLYDLTTMPPVLRFFPTSSVKLSGGGSWQHSSVIDKTYSDMDLQSILVFLQEALRQ
jgi:mono/diheme cytochrome c family protein